MKSWYDRDIKERIFERESLCVDGEIILRYKLKNKDYKYIYYDPNAEEPPKQKFHFDMLADPNFREEDLYEYPAWTEIAYLNRKRRNWEVLLADNLNDECYDVIIKIPCPNAIYIQLEYSNEEEALKNTEKWLSTIIKGSLKQNPEFIQFLKYYIKSENMKRILKRLYRMNNEKKELYQSKNWEDYRYYSIEGIGIKEYIAEDKELLSLIKRVSSKKLFDEFKSLKIKENLLNEKALLNNEEGRWAIFPNQFKDEIFSIYELITLDKECQIKYESLLDQFTFRDYLTEIANKLDGKWNLYFSKNYQCPFLLKESENNFFLLEAEKKFSMERDIFESFNEILNKSEMLKENDEEIKRKIGISKYLIDQKSLLKEEDKKTGSSSWAIWPNEYKDEIFSMLDLIPSEKEYQFTTKPLQDDYSFNKSLMKNADKLKGKWIIYYSKKMDYPYLLRESENNFFVLSPMTPIGY